MRPDNQTQFKFHSVSKHSLFASLKKSNVAGSSIFLLHMLTCVLCLETNMETHSTAAVTAAKLVSAMFF